MGCDYYHEAIKVGHDGVTEDDVSDEPGELKFIVKVYDEDREVERKSVSVEVPVGGKVYLDRLKDDQIWAR